MPKKISNMTEKTSLHIDDVLPILDSEDSNLSSKNKKVKAKNIIPDSTNPLSISLEELNDTIILSCSLNSTRVSTNHKIYRSSDDLNYETIGEIEDSNTSGNDFIFVDDNYPYKGTWYYKLISFNSDKPCSTPISESITTTANASDPPSVSVIANYQSFNLHIVPSNTNYRLLDSFEIKMDKGATSGELAEGSATILESNYKGLDYFYQIADGDKNKYFQFWVSSNTKTS